MTNPVYVATVSTFHGRPDCSRLQIASSFEVIDLQDRGKRTPCQVCLPHPRVKYVKRYCTVCDPGRIVACAHNGGILVEETCVTSYYSALRMPGDTYTRKRYVWPDRAHLYTLVAT